MSRSALSPAEAIARAKSIAPDALDPSLSRQAPGVLAAVLAIGAIVGMAVSLDVDPSAIGKGWDNIVRFLKIMAHPSDGGMPHRIYGAMVETIAMAVLATAIAALVAFPLGLLGARTIVGNRVFHFGLRRFLDAFRGAPALVWALVLVSAVGLGPLPGVLAMALADIPNMAKLFAEAIENVDERPRDGVRAAGGGDLAGLRYAVAPQVAPVMASQTLYFLESNFRNAAVLGIVGAGGIGLELDERIRVFAFDQVAYILIVYIICVMALDFMSASLRRRLM